MKAFVEIPRMDRIYQLGNDLAVERCVELDRASVIPTLDHFSKEQNSPGRP